jgi:hypothetical protein
MQLTEQPIRKTSRLKQSQNSNKINVDPLKSHFCAIEIGTNKVCQDPLVPRPVLFYDLFNWQVGVSN